MLAVVAKKRCSIVAGALLSISGCDIQRAKETSQATFAKKEPEVWMEGIHHLSFIDGNLKHKTSIDEIVIAPRSFSFFNVRYLNEMVISNLDIQTFVSSKGKEAEGSSGLMPDLYQASGPLRGSPFDKPHGTVTRLIANNVTVTLVQDGIPALAIHALHARLKGAKAQTFFRDATVHDLESGRSISSATIIWDEGNKEFIVPGEYTARAGDKLARGEGIKVDLNFGVTRLSSRQALTTLAVD